jgi:hypothetical protein
MMLYRLKTYSRYDGILFIGFYLDVYEDICLNIILFYYYVLDSSR